MSLPVDVTKTTDKLKNDLLVIEEIYDRWYDLESKLPEDHPALEFTPDLISSLEDTRDSLIELTEVL